MREINKICSDIGVRGEYLPVTPQWIVSAVMGAAGLASSLFGGASAAKAAREAKKRQKQQEAKENAWYQRRYNQDYVDTAAGQNIVRMAKDHYNKTVKRAEGARAVTGGTDASVAMAKEQANKGMGDIIANMSATDVANKNHVDNLHRQAEERYAQMDMARENQRAQGITQAAQGASNAIMSLGGAIDQASAPKPDMSGGSNNSAPVWQSTENHATETPPYVETDPLTGLPVRV